MCRGMPGKDKRGAVLPLLFRDFFKLELGLDCLMVMCIGAGGGFTEHLALGDFTDEHHVAAQILLVHHLAGEHGVGVLGQVQQTVVAALCISPGIQLADFPASLHTEVADSFKRHILAQHADIEHTGALDHLFGQISALAGDGDAGGLIGHLNTGVDDAAVVLVFLCGQHEQSVGQIPCGRRVDRRFVLLSESNAPADPSEPCRG